MDATTRTPRFHKEFKGGCPFPGLSKVYFYVDIPVPGSKHSDVEAIHGVFDGDPVLVVMVNDWVAPGGRCQEWHLRLNPSIAPRLVARSLVRDVHGRPDVLASARKWLKAHKFVMVAD